MSRQYLVQEHMSAPAISVAPDTTLEQAMSLMVLEGIHCLPVIDDAQKLLGIVTDHDLRLFANSPFLASATPQLADTLCQHKVSEIMQRQVLTITAQQPLAKAVQLMRHNTLVALPVTNDEQEVVGVITRTDVLDFVLQFLS